jgi:hypothetical protein
MPPFFAYAYYIVRADARQSLWQKCLGATVAATAGFDIAIGI